MRARLRVLYVVGTRPNFVKVAPVVAAGGAWNEAAAPSELHFEQALVHTGQHYDEALSAVFFDQLGLPEPDAYLGVGSGTQAMQTARLLEALEPVVVERRPDLVLVPGDVNSTMAAALVAAKLHVPVAHLEAGLRSGDREMPEEINRIVADHLSELLFTTCEDADINLAAEGIGKAGVRNVGNTMIDTLLHLLPRVREGAAAARGGVGLAADEPFVLVTLHRPSNVDEPAQLAALCGVLAELAEEVAVVFPVHLRTRARLEAAGLAQPGARGRLIYCPPLGYLDFLGLMDACAAVITDSGGVQEETTALGVPCVTVRTTTERPITVTAGTNVLVDPYDPAAVLAASRRAVERGRLDPPPQIDLWDGRAADRVVAALAEWALARPV
ncbi:MAG TPA: UDP-N-acetylglucosamine 2-epimerase (non-hydrolyzing) [Thermoleophilia bacterium]|nr:UDP-N-acetylglucosamine 2-epimerase (non-hydrolyzing) [Thermoleophilia bacterium]